MDETKEERIQSSDAEEVTELQYEGPRAQRLRETLERSVDCTIKDVRYGLCFYNFISLHISSILFV